MVSFGFTNSIRRNEETCICCCATSRYFEKQAFQKLNKFCLYISCKCFCAESYRVYQGFDKLKIIIIIGIRLQSRHEQAVQKMLLAIKMVKSDPKRSISLLLPRLRLTLHFVCSQQPCYHRGELPSMKQESNAYWTSLTGIWFGLY